MNNTLIFLRHGETKVDKDTPISEWDLTTEGARQAQDIAQNTFFHDVDIFIISTEKKAQQTIAPLLDTLREANRKFEVMYSSEIAEMDRDKGDFMDHDTYEATAKEALTHPEVKANDGKWESAASARERFTTKVGIVDAENHNRKILFVGHGYTMNMYIAELQGEQDVYSRLKRNNFGDWSVVRNGKVIKDFHEPLDRLGERLV
ncbi:MAG TPA: histidine phosphatase family protein [Candidatus Paceibacterota bacterium]|nr:histidine phosphatase family protein [Candidatus Paceibacterota bacterium]